MNNYKKLGLTKALDIQTIFKSVDEEKSFLLMGTEILYHQPKISAKAKLILAYILSRPPYWEVSITDISAHVKDGRDGIRSGLKELEEYGYIIRFDVRDLKGKILGNLIFAYDTSQLEKKEGIIAEAKLGIKQKLENMSPEEIEVLTSSGISRNGKSDASINNKSNNKSNMCMNGSHEPDNHDKLNTSTEEVEIMEELYNGCIKIDEPGFFNEIYTMLTRKFKGQLDARIIELAFSRYLEKREDLYNGNEIEIINPAGWFYDAYRDAIKIYKAQRYANNKEKEQIAQELKQVHNMHFSHKNKYQ